MKLYTLEGEKPLLRLKKLFFLMVNGSYIYNPILFSRHIEKERKKKFFIFVK
jgi:hypothetical protein